jgi:hypothetical protein
MLVIVSQQLDSPAGTMAHDDSQSVSAVQLGAQVPPVPVLPTPVVTAATVVLPTPTVVAGAVVVGPLPPDPPPPVPPSPEAQANMSAEPNKANAVSGRAVFTCLA